MRALLLREGHVSSKTRTSHLKEKIKTLDASLSNSSSQWVWITLHPTSVRVTPRHTSNAGLNNSVSPTSNVRFASSARPTFCNNWSPLLGQLAPPHNGELIPIMEEFQETIIPLWLLTDSLRSYNKVAREEKRGRTLENYELRILKQKTSYFLLAFWGEKEREKE